MADESDHNAAAMALPDSGAVNSGGAVPQSGSADAAAQAQAQAQGPAASCDPTTLALACLAELVPADAGRTAEIDYLRAHLARLPSGRDRHELLLESVLQPAQAHAGLTKLVAAYQLQPAEVLAVALALAVEREPMAGRATAYLQAPVAGSRPTLGLLGTAFAKFAPRDWVIGQLAAGAAVRAGILQVLDQGPLPERAVAVPTELVLAMMGLPGALPALEAELPGVLLPESVVRAASGFAHSLLDCPRTALLVRCPSRIEGRAAAVAVSRQLGRKAVRVTEDQTAGLGPACLLRELVPVFEFDLLASERQALPALSGYDGPVLVVANTEGSVIAEGRTVLQWPLTMPDRGERTALWNAYLRDAELAAALGSKHLHGAGRIHELAQLAERERLVRNADAIGSIDVSAAAWASPSSHLATLAQPVPHHIENAALVVNAVARHELERLEARCRTREGLDATLGISIKARYSAGVRALLVGPSGTGKTMAASWLATRLGMPLYRVDLAAVVSKYIGETEKNLSELLARAEVSDVILLFDEADSMFGKRTDIKDSTDRFANSQTNYLLQRIETYQGIVLLTSNSRSRFDTAFARRLDMVIELPLPTPEERHGLWQVHLGDEHMLARAEVNKLAAKCDLGGGHIRNAVLTAAVLARSGNRVITYADVLEGVDGEYRKLSKQTPVALKV